MSEGEATDPLREALEDIATRPTVERNPDGDDQAATTMQLIARAALAAAPEPEWEYRAIRGHTYSGAWPSKAKARYHGALGFGPDTPFTIERRRKAGEWEALPEPCPACGGRGWHTAGGNDPAACNCAAGEAWHGGEALPDD